MAQVNQDQEASAELIDVNKNDSNQKQVNQHLEKGVEQHHEEIKHLISQSDFIKENPRPDGKDLQLQKHHNDSNSQLPTEDVINDKPILIEQQLAHQNRQHQNSHQIHGLQNMVNHQTNSAQNHQKTQTHLVIPSAYEVITEPVSSVHEIKVDCLPSHTEIQTEAYKQSQPKQQMNKVQQEKAQQQMKKMQQVLGIPQKKVGIDLPCESQEVTTHLTNSGKHVHFHKVVSVLDPQLDSKQQPKFKRLITTELKRPVGIDMNAQPIKPREQRAKLNEPCKCIIM